MNNAAKEVKIIRATKGMEVPMLRVAAYCRVSSDSSDQENSFLAQMRHYNDYIRHNENMTLVDIYADEGITGTEMQKRDEFKRLLKDSKNGKIDCVLVKSVTRFARNSLECLEAVRALKSYGTSVYFENDRLDTARMNSEMMLYIKGAFAQSEAQSASKRMKMSIRMRMEEGTYGLPTAPYGYRLQNGELQIAEEEAEKVKRIFAMYLSGKGINAIVQAMRKFETENIIWSRGRVNYILTNEKYIGDSLLHKYYTPSVLPLRCKLNRGEEAKYYIQDTHEPIITKEVFEQAQELCKKRTEKFNKARNENQPFFHSRIRCRKCGWAYKSFLKNGELFWTCRKKGIVGTECHSLTYSDTEIQSAFVKMYNILQQNSKVLVDETIAQLQQLKVKANSGNNEIVEIDDRLATLAEQNSVYTELFTSGVLDEVTYHEKTDRFKRELTELRSRRYKILNEDENERCIEKLRQLRRYLADSPAYLTAMDNKIFTDTVDKIFAEEDGALTFRLQCELELKVYVRR